LRNTDQSAQTQISVEMDMLFPTNRVWSLRVIRGERVLNQLVLAQTVSISFVQMLKQKPISVDFAYSDYSGGRLLGHNRDDSMLSALLSYPLSRQVRVSFGYQFINSTIDYFDSKTPLFALNFQALQF